MAGCEGRGLLCLSSLASLRIRITRTNNPDVVVREAAVELRILVFRHVAGDAASCIYRARRWSGTRSTLGDAGGGVSVRNTMARKALSIVKGGIAHERLMWIMTCDARDARVGPAPASAL